jgi:hypothetical protein
LKRYLMHKTAISHDQKVIIMCKNSLLANSSDKLMWGNIIEVMGDVMFYDDVQRIMICFICKAFHYYDIILISEKEIANKESP